MLLRVRHWWKHSTLTFKNRANSYKYLTSAVSRIPWYHRAHKSSWSLQKWWGRRRIWIWWWIESRNPILGSLSFSHRSIKKKKLNSCQQIAWILTAIKAAKCDQSSIIEYLISSKIKSRYGSIKLTFLFYWTTRVNCPALKS